MSIISRLTTWTIGQVLKAADLNGEFSNITNLLNNLDAATTSWTNVKTATLTPTNVGPFTATGAIAMGTNKITGLGNGTAAQDAAAFGQVKVLQTILGTSTSRFTTTSATFQTTNLSATITPTSASNRIFVLAASQFDMGTQNKIGYLTISRGGTNILATNGQLEALTATGGVTQWPATLITVDSPATTSATTYAIQIKSGDGVTTAGWGDTNLTQTIILMEVV